MSIEFPDDADGEALKLLAEKGLDMRQAVSFEFSIHVSSEEGARIVSERLRTAGLGESIEAVYDEGELGEGEDMTAQYEQFWPSWTVYVYRTMAPDYRNVVEFQRALADICHDMGEPSGWTVEIG
jgi:hypothetical protein